MAKAKRHREAIAAAPRVLNRKAKAKRDAVAARARDPAPGALYKRGDMILLVGEGDFSFSCALLQKFGQSAYLVATVLDTMKSLRSKYPAAKANAQCLTAAGMQVKCGTDCRLLHTITEFKGTFTKIVFNFPHLGGDGDSTMEHQKLLQDFFCSAAQCLDPLPESEIHVTLKAGEPYNTWAVTHMAKLSRVLRFKRAVPFDALRYPGYAHCRTRGAAYAAARGLSDVNVVEGARTYVFGLRQVAPEAGAA